MMTLLKLGLSSYHELEKGHIARKKNLSKKSLESPVNIEVSRTILLY